MNQQIKKAEDDHIPMDYSLDDPQARVEKVNEIIKNTPPEKLTSQYLTKMADYIMDLKSARAEKKREYSIITKNKMVSINNREMSFEGLAERLENGEDGIYNMIANDKTILFTPKKGFTKDDIENIPGLKELREAIKKVEEDFAKATGKRKFKLKQQIFAMQSDQYELKKMFCKPIRFINTRKGMHKLDLSENVKLVDNKVISDGLINLYNPTHISLLLCNYSDIKEDTWDKFDSDLKWMMEDLDDIIINLFKEDYPLYYKIIVYKIDGKQNAEIQQLLLEEFGVTHTVEYISSLWRNKIPKMIAEAAADKWIIWYYTNVEEGTWKKCSKCGQIKLANNRFFSKNSTSKDGFYSICKCCRNKKK